MTIGIILYIICAIIQYLLTDTAIKMKEKEDPGYFKRNWPTITNKGREVIVILIAIFWPFALLLGTFNIASKK